MSRRYYKATFDCQGRILELMRQNGIETNRQLADLCDVTDSAVTRWLMPGRELGVGTLEMICKKAFRIELCEFFSKDIPVYRGDAFDKELRLIWRQCTGIEKDVIIKHAKIVLKCRRYLGMHKDYKEIGHAHQ